MSNQFLGKFLNTYDCSSFLFKKKIISPLKLDIIQLKKNLFEKRKKMIFYIHVVLKFLNILVLF